MKTRKNRHTRNRTSRRRMKGGGHEEDIALIRKFLVPIPADLIRGNEGQKYQYKPLNEFLDNIVPRGPDMREFIRIFKEYPIPQVLAGRLQATLAEIDRAEIRRKGTTVGQPFLLSLAQRFQSELAEILPVVIGNPPARKANIDWFPSLQKLHRIAKDYASFRAPTQGARINAKFDRVDTASKKDATENRKGEAERKLLESTAEFSKDILSRWFDKVRGLVDVPSPFREQAIADIWALVPPDMPEQLVRELHSIFDRHTAFLSAKELDVPLAPPLVAPQARPDRPGRKVLAPRPDETSAPILAPPLPPSAPGTPVLTGEFQIPPKELPEVFPAGPAPGLGVPESAPVAAPVARRGDRVSKSLPASARLAATPALPSFGTSAPAPQFPSPGPKPLPVPQYTSADVPGPTDVERGALVSASDRAPLPVRVEGEVPVHEPLPSLDEGAAPPGRVPVKEPGLFDGLTSLLPTFLSGAPSQVSPAPPIVSPGPEVRNVAEYVAQPGPSVSKELQPLGEFPAVAPLESSPPTPYNPFKSYATPPLASVTSGPLSSPGTYAPYSFLNPETQVPSNTSLATQATPAVPGLKSEEQKAFEKGAYQSIDTTKSLCERLHPRLYEILKTGQFNGKSISTLLNEQGPELQAFFAEIQFVVAAKTLMGHPISEIYKACHPDRTIDDQNLTTIFQTLQALYNYTPDKAPVLSLPSILRIASQTVKPVQAPGSKPERPGKKPSAVAPPIGDLSKIFTKGDRLRPRGNITDPATGQSVLLTVVGNYIADTQSIEVAYGNQTLIVTVEELSRNFQVIPRKVEKRLFKQGDRVLIKNPRNIERFPLAIRAEVQKSTCNDPFYATVERDQEVNLRYVKIVCDKGGRYNAEDEELIYIPPGPARLTRTPGEAPPQPTPVAALADSGAPILRKGDRATGAPSALGAPATTTDCDRKLIGMTDRAKTCEENLAQVKAQLEAALAAHAAETAKLQGDLGASKEALRRMEGVKAGLESELARTNRALELIRNMLGEQTRKLGTLNTRYETLDKQKVKLEGQLAGEQGKSSKLEGQLAAEQGKSSGLQGELTNEKGVSAKLSGQLQDLETRRASLASQNLQLEGRIAELEATLEGQEELTEEQEDELAKLRRSLGQQKKQIATLDSQLAAERGTNAGLSGQLAAEQGKSSGLEGQLAAERGANAEEQGRLRASLADITGKLGQVKDERGILQIEIDRQRGELDVLERKAADLETQFASTKALIIQKGDEIRRDLQASVARIDSGLQIINDGVDDVADLVREAKEQIGESRADFVRKINALQRELEASNLQGRQEVLANIGALRFENQQALGALNAGLAAAMAETARLNELLRTETAAKAQAEGALQAAQAAAAEAAAAQARELAAARDASDRAFAEFKAASETASAEEREKLIAEAHLAMEELGRGLNEQQALAVARADEAARRDLGAQLAALQAQIASLPPPYVPPQPLPPQPFPIITGRTPAGEVLPGSDISIQWNPRGTIGPWILKIFYNERNPDFKDIQVAGDITYTVKQPGALTGQIFSIV